MIEDAKIIVTPSVLRQRAANVDTQITNMKNCLENLESRLLGTSYYWIGEAGDLHRELYQDQKADIEQMLRRWREHTQDLRDIADVYDTVESQNSQIGESLGETAGLM